jgi:ankyrin repeat protein
MNFTYKQMITLIFVCLGVGKQSNAMEAAPAKQPEPASYVCSFAQEITPRTKLNEAYAERNLKRIKKYETKYRELIVEDFLHASSYGEMEKIKLLLDAQIDPNIQDLNDLQRGYFPLLLAAREGHLAIVELLAKHDAKLEKQEFKHENTSLIEVAARNIGARSKRNYEMAKLLLTLGAKPNTKNKAGSTALTISAEHGREDFVELLLAHGADASAIQTKWITYPKIKAMLEDALKKSK